MPFFYPGPLRVGDVRTLPTGPGSAREADLVRGPAYDGMLLLLLLLLLLAFKGRSSGGFASN